MNYFVEKIHRWIDFFLPLQSCKQLSVLFFLPMFFLSHFSKRFVNLADSLISLFFDPCKNADKKTEISPYLFKMSKFPITSLSFLHHHNPKLIIQYFGKIIFWASR